VFVKVAIPIFFLLSLFVSRVIFSSFSSFFFFRFCFSFCFSNFSLTSFRETKLHIHMAGFWTTFLQREPIVVWSCALGAIGAALPVCVPPIRNMFRSDAEPTRPPSAASVVAALRGGKS
jgi:hypothetical protein